MGPELQKSTKGHGKAYSILVCFTARNVPPRALCADTENGCVAD